MGTLSLLCVFVLTLVSISSLPVKFENLDSSNKLPNILDTIPSNVIDTNVNINSDGSNVGDVAKLTNDSVVRSNELSRTMRNQLRPGMLVNSYTIEIEPDGDSFTGRAIIQVSITDATTRDDPVMFYVRDLNIASVSFTLLGGTTLMEADFDVDDDDGILEIDTGLEATLYTFHIEYSSSTTFAGRGLWSGHYNGFTYLAMNLHPTHARRVFPCMDEPTEASTITFTFNNVGYNNLIGNSLLQENSENQFRALQGPAHLWGIVAHNMIQLMSPFTNVILFARQGVISQDFQTSVAISSYFNNMNEWTQKSYFEIVMNQDTSLSILALPDVATEWHALSTIGIWEPYILMEQVHSILQRKTGLVKLAEAIAKQWFGYVIFPENWRYEWVVSGLASYAAWEMFNILQTGTIPNDITMLDVNTLFVTEVIQESLLRDGLASSRPLEAANDLFDENEIRDHIYGVLKYKAPAVLRMFRMVLGGPNDRDFIQAAGSALLTARSLQTVNTLNFIDAINSDWIVNGNGAVDDFAEFLEPWITTTGYPLLHVGLRQGGVLLTQERFMISAQPHVNYVVPITYTTSMNPDFDEPNTYPMAMMDATTTLNMMLDEEEGDFVLFNIQGQGYYRVNYDGELWERIIEALEDPDRREQIHPLNRATLVDDALNLARAGRLDYEIALLVVLSMEHETEYAVWKAFVRNMDFLRKHLVAMVTEDEDLDPDIYLRMVRRTIGAVEDRLGFYPDTLISEPVMDTLTRGLVMDHACRAGYRPCIAAAVDWFYDPGSNEPTVNPSIPHDIRPAVYCTMVREGDNDVIAALYNRLEIEPTIYERVVILESLACSQDAGFISTYLVETIADNSPYTTEEKSRIFKAVAESSFQNALLALNFMSQRVIEIRNMYGGSEKLDELLFALGDNMVNFLGFDFRVFVLSQNNNLDDSQDIGERALSAVNENINWELLHMDYVYEWIDENDASTMMMSLLLLCISLAVALFNH